MSRIVLTVGGVGKTYTDKHFKNVYDFDQHTLDYLYYRDGFEHLSDEEFKGQPNRKRREHWFEKYMVDFCHLIDSNQYDVVLSWVNKDCIDYLLEHNYPVELVLVNPDSDMTYYMDMLRSRGNIDISITNTIMSYRSTCDTFIPLKGKLKNLYVVSNKTRLSDLLLFSGTNLIDLYGNILSVNDIDENKRNEIERDATPL